MWQEFTDRQKMVMVALVFTGIVVVILAIWFLPGGGGSDNTPLQAAARATTRAPTDNGSEPFNGLDEGRLKNSVAKQFNTTTDKIACQNEGVWDDPNGGSRNVSFCRVVGGYDFERGCYDSITYDDITVWIRNDEGPVRMCAQ
jgi:hypothetical protein